MEKLLKEIKGQEFITLSQLSTLIGESEEATKAIVADGYMAYTTRSKMFLVSYESAMKYLMGAGRVRTQDAGVMQRQLKAKRDLEAKEAAAREIRGNINKIEEANKQLQQQDKKVEKAKMNEMDAALAAEKAAV